MLLDDELGKRTAEAPDVHGHTCILYQALFSNETIVCCSPFVGLLITHRRICYHSRTSRYREEGEPTTEGTCTKCQHAVGEG